MRAPARATKIVCTIGPATSSEDAIRGLIAEGRAARRGWFA